MSIFRRLKMLKKTIEIYDGNYSSHKICLFGAVIIGIGMLCFLLAPIFDYLNFGWKNPLFLSLPLFFIGSLIGKD